MRIIILLLVVGGAIAVVAGSLVYARRRGRLFIEDVVTLIGAPLIFVAVGLLRSELVVGWALVLWPIVVALICAYLFGFKVIVIDHMSPSWRRNSRVMLAVIFMASAVTALTVPPWYE